MKLIKLLFCLELHHHQGPYFAFISENSISFLIVWQFSCFPPLFFGCSNIHVRTFCATFFADSCNTKNHPKCFIQMSLDSRFLVDFDYYCQFLVDCSDFQKNRPLSWGFENSVSVTSKIGLIGQQIPLLGSLNYKNESSLRPQEPKPEPFWISNQLFMNKKAYFTVVWPNLKHLLVKNHIKEPLKWFHGRFTRKLHNFQVLSHSNPITVTQSHFNGIWTGRAFFHFSQKKIEFFHLR